MLHQTQGIVLRSVKYGETSIITTVFTQQFGIQSYIVQGVRTAKSKQHKAALLQPATLLNLVVYHVINKNIQYLREYHTAFIYRQLQEQVVRNSIALFSVELLIKLLPEHAPQQDLFSFAFQYFQLLDSFNENEIANFPLFFTLYCSKLLGYEIKGIYTRDTPYLNILEGGYSTHQPLLSPPIKDEDAIAFQQLLLCNDFDALKKVEMNASIRFRLLDWQLAFLHYYCQHLGNLKSLSVLRTILH